MRRPTFVLMLALALAIAQLRPTVATAALYARCTPGAPACPPATVCAGPPGRERCVIPQPAGASCAPASHWPCAGPHVCISGTCSLPQGAACGHAPKQCAPHTACTLAQPRVCAPARALHAPCDPTAPCGAALACGPDAKCVPRRGAAALGDSCLADTDCAESTAVCAGPPGEKWCVAARGPHAWCGGPYRVCGKGLACMYEKCHHVVAVGAKCGGGGMTSHGLCPWHAVCAGTEGNKRCVPLVRPGGRCGLDPEWRCGQQAQCKDGFCVGWQ